MPWPIGKDWYRAGPYLPLQPLLEHLHLTLKEELLLLPCQWQQQDHDDVDNNASAACCDVMSLCRPYW